MKTAKNLKVTVKYSVGLGNVKMPQKVYDQLSNAIEKGDEIDANTPKYYDAADWLSNNIRERDCMDWECEIDELE